MNFPPLRLLLSAALSVAACSSWAQADSARLVTRATMVGLGCDNMLDTYLSEEKFSGLQLSFVSHIERQREGRAWSREIVHRAAVAEGWDRSHDNRILGAMYDMQYRWMRQVVQTECFRLKAGVGANGFFDVLYMPGNGNNPVQLHMGASAVAAANAAYHFHIRRLPVAVCWDVSAPVLGVAFSPAYGQSYYELFGRGNYDRNVVVSQPFNMPSMRHLFAFDFGFRSVSLRIGYLGDYRQSKFHDIKYHEWQHSVVVGVIKRFMIIPGR